MPELGAELGTELGAELGAWFRDSRQWRMNMKVKVIRYISYRHAYTWLILFCSKNVNKSNSASHVYCEKESTLSPEIIFISSFYIRILNMVSNKKFW